MFMNLLRTATTGWLQINWFICCDAYICHVIYILTLPKLINGSEGGSLHFQFRLVLGFASVNYNEFSAEMHLQKLTEITKCYADKQIHK